MSEPHYPITPGPWVKTFAQTWTMRPSLIEDRAAMASLVDHLSERVLNDIEAQPAVRLTPVTAMVHDSYLGFFERDLYCLLVEATALDLLTPDLFPFMVPLPRLQTFINRVKRITNRARKAFRS